MKIIVNGQPRDVGEGVVVSALLEELNLAASATVVLRNDAMVPRETYGQTALSEGDALELVRFVGGG